MNVLDCSDRAALVRDLEALPEGTWVHVVTDGQRHLLRRVPGGWHLTGDMAVASEDVADGEPTHVEVLGLDDHLPPEEAIAEARRGLDVARAVGDSEAVETLSREMDDLDSVGWPEAGALRDEALAWLDGQDG